MRLVVNVCWRGQCRPVILQTSVSVFVDPSVNEQVVLVTIAASARVRVLLLTRTPRPRRSSSGVGGGVDVTWVPFYISGPRTAPVEANMDRLTQTGRYETAMARIVDGTCSAHKNHSAPSPGPLPLR